MSFIKPSTKTKWALSTMAGAPGLNYAAGGLLPVLDAFWVNGFGVKAVDSASVTDGVCRLAISGGSAAQAQVVILVGGITGVGSVLNAEQRVSAAANTYVEFLCDLPDGPLTGTITFKIAGLGWEKVFSKTNVAVYRPTDPSGARPFIRIDDTNALFARVQLYESMTDVDTGVAAAPTTVSGGYYWHKRTGTVNPVAPTYWGMAGDSRGSYLGVALVNAVSVTAADNAGYGLMCYAVGDLNSYRSGDACCPVLTGTPTTSGSDMSGCIFTTSASTGITLQRLSAGVGGAVQATRAVWGNATSPSGADASQGAFPSRTDNGLRLSPILISDGAMATNGPRGELPGAYHCSQSGVLASMGAGFRLTPGHGQFAGRHLLSFGCGTVSTATGCGFIDVTGDWRL